jgi:septal ring factor EnvC (AmiA/AmiB activator)
LYRRYAEAGAEYEATLRKLRDSHEAELAGLKAANDQLLATLRSEGDGEESKLRTLVDSLSSHLKSAEDAIEAERALRLASERAARLDLEARRVAEQERARCDSPTRSSAICRYICSRARRGGAPHQGAVPGD